MSKKVWFLLFVANQVFSQQVLFTGTLLDASTKTPIVYANISFLNTTKGISSTENGTFQLYVDEKYMKGKIHVSCLNYKDTIVDALSIQNKVFLLQPKRNELEEVVITKRVESSFLQDKVKKKVYGVHSAGMRMMAKYFPMHAKNNCCKFVGKVAFYFSKRHNKKAKFRVRVFSKDENTGFPKEDILKVNVPVVIKEKQLSATVDLSKYDIEMPDNGLFIAFEKLFVPYNAYGKSKTASNNEILYAPIIGFTKYKHKKTKERTYYYVNGFWTKSAINKVQQFRKYAPAISLTLTN